MTKKMIEKYVTLDMKGNLIENIEDMETTTLRIYNREISATVIKIDSGKSDFNFFVAKACIDACNEYVPVPEDIELDNGDENDYD